MSLVIGIDATNIRQGGGITHLLELLSVDSVAVYGIKQVVIVGNQFLLDQISERPWLKKVAPNGLKASFVRRIFWQFFCLPQLIADLHCDVLLSASGVDYTGFRPLVSISQNLLPFELAELKRFGFSLTTIRLLILRCLQLLAFRRSAGIIFLTDYARDQVLAAAHGLRAEKRVIPHGLNKHFLRNAKPQRPINEYTDENPFRILYVSIINEYKHQREVVEAISILRTYGWPVVLDLVGPAYPPSLIRLKKSIELYDPGHRWIYYHGSVPYSAVDSCYSAADMAIWASTCETFGIILLEAMASGLPLACSSKEPSPEIVADAAIYFDPECPRDIARALNILISSTTLRSELAEAGIKRSQEYSWQRCSDQTFAFLADIARKHKIQHSL